MKYLLGLIMLIALVSCEQKVSWYEYDSLHQKYLKKQQEINSLMYECDEIQKNIKSLQSTEEKLKRKIRAYEYRIEKAIDAAEKCEEHYEDLERGRVDVNPQNAKTLVENVKTLVNSCTCAEYD